MTAPEPLHCRMHLQRKHSRTFVPHRDVKVSVKDTEVLSPVNVELRTIKGPSDNFRDAIDKGTRYRDSLVTTGTRRYKRPTLII